MSVKAGEIIRIIEEFAPINYAYQWDNVGLQIGSRKDEIQRILTTLEVTEAVLDEAIENNVQMIITHHPMIFSPLKKIIKEDLKGRLVYKAIQNNIAIYAAHTNMDIAPGGLNDYIVGLLNLKNIEILDMTEKESYYKLAVFIPVGYEEKVGEAISRAGAGHIGNYSHCTFRTNGTGTFKPLEGTNPFIGSKGEFEKVEEIKLETIVPEKILNSVLSEMLKAHPYEEVAYDLYPLANEGNAIGIGRVGKLDQARKLSDLVEMIKDKMNIGSVRIAGNLNDLIEKVAVVNGSGAEYVNLAIRQGCQCIITGDVKYHDAQDAISQGINVIDIGHYDSEKFFAQLLADYLAHKIKEKGLKVDVMASKLDINPFQVV